MCLRGLLELEGDTGGGGGAQGGVSSPSGCTRRFPRAVWLLDAGGFSTAPVAPGRYVFSAGTYGVSIPGGGMAGGGGGEGVRGAWARGGDVVA